MVNCIQISSLSDLEEGIFTQISCLLGEHLSLSYEVFWDKVLSTSPVEIILLCMKYLASHCAGESENVSIAQWLASFWKT